MKAILTTRCGCQREFEITFPPPPYILIPLQQKELNRGWLKCIPEPPNTPNERVRKFIRDIVTRKAEDGIAFYVECEV